MKKCLSQEGSNGGVWVKVSALAVIVFASMLGCSGQNLKDPDGDGVHTQARPFAKEEPTKDKLDPTIGDKQDWRFIQATRSGNLEMRISVGKWSESTIRGSVVVKTEVGDTVIEKPLPEGSGDISFEFEVAEGKRYLVNFIARSGAGQYAVEVKYAGNPCDACTPEQICQDNACVAKPEPQPKPKKRKRRTGGGSSKPKATSKVCKVIDARPVGSGSVLTLSCGDNKGIKRGAKGSIRGRGGSTLVITQVFPTRSKAKCKLNASKFRPGDSAVVR